MSIPRGLLAPLTPLYAAAVEWRSRRYEREPAQRLQWPVVSIGNLSTGGAGKTPLAITLASALSRRGLAVDVLSRGYGRSSKAPARVQPEGRAEDFGDEPLLMARATGLPVYVAAQRYEAGLLAEAGNAAGLHILDDGFQHRQLHRDVDILLLNRRDLADSLLPAGNLREPLTAFKRATIIAIPVDEPELEAELRQLGWQGPIWRLRRSMQIPALVPRPSGAPGPSHLGTGEESCSGEVGVGFFPASKVLAFCGIARPEQFFDGLQNVGVQIAARSAFADHHRYSAADLRRLAALARKAGATALLTTEKDAVRLGALRDALPLPLLTVGLRTEIVEEAAAIDWLLHRLGLRG